MTLDSITGTGHTDMGQPALNYLTQEQYDDLEVVAPFLSDKQIGEYLEIPPRRWARILKEVPQYRARINKARSKMTAAVGQQVVKSAMNGNIYASRLYLERKGDWVEKEEAPDPTPINIQIVQPSGATEDAFDYTEGDTIDLGDEDWDELPHGKD